MEYALLLQKLNQALAARCEQLSVARRSTDIPERLTTEDAEEQGGAEPVTLDSSEKAESCTAMSPLGALLSDDARRDEHIIGGRERPKTSSRKVSDSTQSEQDSGEAPMAGSEPKQVYRAVDNPLVQRGSEQQVSLEMTELSSQRSSHP